MSNMITLLSLIGNVKKDEKFDSLGNGVLKKEPNSFTF